jgi:cysteine synthase
MLQDMERGGLGHCLDQVGWGGGCLSDCSVYTRLYYLKASKNHHLHLQKHLRNRLQTPKPVAQYNNSDNTASHFLGTGPEIWRQTSGRVTHLVSTCGTFGTIMGTGSYLKSQNPEVQVIGVQPAVSDDGAASLLAAAARYSGDGCIFGGSEAAASPPPEAAAAQQIPGIRRWPPGYMPDLYSPEGLDRVIDVSAREAEESARALARAEGILPGISGGGAVSAALRLSAEVEGAVIVAVIPDKGDRYLSTGGCPGWWWRDGDALLICSNNRTEGQITIHYFTPHTPSPPSHPYLPHPSLTPPPTPSPPKGVFSAEAAARDPAPCPATEFHSALARLLFACPGPHYVMFRSARGGAAREVAAAAAARAAVEAGGGRVLEVVVADALQHQHLRLSLR